MTRVGRALSVRGEVSSTGDLTIDGRVEGSVWCDGHTVTIAATGVLDGYVIARDITVHGTTSGTLVATEVVDIRPEASVKGRIVAPRLILADGGSLDGAVEPQHLEAALRVAHHRHPDLVDLRAGKGSHAATARHHAAPLRQPVRARSRSYD